MAFAKLDVEVQDLIRKQKMIEAKIAQTEGGPFLLQAMRTATLIVQRDAKINAPVDTGRLRASIVPTIQKALYDGSITGLVGSNVEYAPYQEFGTRRGIRPKRYLLRAFEDNQHKIIQIFEDAIRRIVNG